MMVPDTFLLSSTREVEPVLNELVAKGFLTYSMKDSSRLLQAFPDSTSIATRDSIVFYHYTLHWGTNLDSFHVKVRGPPNGYPPIVRPRISRRISLQPLAAMAGSASFIRGERFAEIPLKK